MEHTDPLLIIASVILLGAVAQIVAAALRLPAIISLLAFGTLVGPVTGLVEPQAVFGSSLNVFVSIAVSIILFEGGLSLNISDLRHVGNTVRNLITVGALVTWVGVSAAAIGILGMEPRTGILFAAILVVTGPTVIGPLLRSIRVKGSIAATLKWEGILNDPIGAILAVLVYQVAVAPLDQAFVTVLVQITRTVLVGVSLATAASGVLIVGARFRLVPEFLHPYLTLGLVVGSFALSNAFQHEAGLLTVTLMGIFLANQDWIEIKFVNKFKEDLTIVLVSMLFILIAANMELHSITGLDWPTVGFVAALIFIVRPLSVVASSFRSKLSRRELFFISFMAPRGIVAAAVSSIFALRLKQVGIAGAEQLISASFFVVVGTCLFYSIAARVMVPSLALGAANPTGLLIIGAHSLAREIAGVLTELGATVMLVDNDWTEAYRAKMAGLEVYYENALSEDVIGKDRLADVAKVIAMTANDEANSLMLLHFAERYERYDLYQLAPSPAERRRRGFMSPRHLRGNFAFGRDASLGQLMKMLDQGGKVRATKLSAEFGLDQFKKTAGHAMVPLFVVHENGALDVIAEDGFSAARPGQTIVGLWP